MIVERLFLLFLTACNCRGTTARSVLLGGKIADWQRQLSSWKSNKLAHFHFAVSPGNKAGRERLSKARKNLSEDGAAERACWMGHCYLQHGCLGSDNLFSKPQEDAPIHEHGPSSVSPPDRLWLLRGGWIKADASWSSESIGCVIW